MTVTIFKTDKQKGELMNACEGCGKVAEIKEVGSFKLCPDCENSFYQVQDDLAEMHQKELEGIQDDYR